MHPEGFVPEAGAGDPVEPSIQADDAAGQLRQRRQPVLGQEELLQAGKLMESIRIRPGDEVAAQVYSLQLLCWDRREEMKREPRESTHSPFPRLDVLSPVKSLAWIAPMRLKRA